VGHVTFLPRLQATLFVGEEHHSKREKVLGNLSEAMNVGFSSLFGIPPHGEQRYGIIPAELFREGRVCLQGGNRCVTCES
jgi:hypothetical protein